MENGNLEDAVGEENKNESIMTDTFEQEVEFENETSANVSDESRSDVNYTSQNQQGFATSSLREGQGKLLNDKQLSVQDLKPFHLCFHQFPVIPSPLQMQMRLVHHYHPNLLNPNLLNLTSLFQGESLSTQEPLGGVTSVHL